MHEVLKLAMYKYYKAERERAEQCLSDILTILCDAGADDQQVDKITQRITQHYERS